MQTGRQAGKPKGDKFQKTTLLRQAHQTPKNLGLQPRTVTMKQEPGTRNTAIMSAQMENQMKKNVRIPLERARVGY
jgi:hypothetical protein